MKVRRTALLVCMGLLVLLPRIARAGGPIVSWTIPTANAQPNGIAYGSDGKYWFTEESGNKIGQILIDDTNGLYPINEFTIPTVNSLPQGICAGPDNNLWFTEKNGNKIGRITTAGVITEFPLPTAGSLPQEICNGPDGALWFTEPGINKVGRITTAGVITEFPLTTPAGSPFGIFAGSDGKLWVTLKDANKVASVTTTGTVTEYTIPTASSSPLGITRGSDNNMWFTESATSKVSKVTTAGVITEYPLAVSGGTPTGIVTGPYGHLYVTEKSGGRVGGITTAGILLAPYYPSAPTSGSQPTGIAFGPNTDATYGSFVMYTSPGTNAVARIYFTASVPTPTPTPTSTPTPAPTPTSPPPVGPMKEYSVQPCRVLDSRNPTGPYGGPALAAGATRAVILWNQCAVPATAKAVGLNITAVQPSIAGHLTVFPSTSPRPLASTLNFIGGQTRANNAVIQLGTDGGINIFGGLASGSVQIIVDVTTYFE